MEKIITLALSVRNDSAGLFFTINSALLNVYKTELENQLEISVVNNSDDPVAREKVRSICEHHGVTKYKEILGIYSNHHGRNEAVRMADTPYVVLADAHVLFMPGFFMEYMTQLDAHPMWGLIHSPFTMGGIPSWRSNCFYNLQKFATNLHGTFSRYGALEHDPYPVALAPHAAYGFRRLQWMEYGGYIDLCLGHGGGEPFVTYKYWMFGSDAWLTPRTGYIHFNSAKYRKVRSWWRWNHAVVASALGGKEVGQNYAERLLGKVRMRVHLEKIWQVAEPLYVEIKKKTVVPFDKLTEHFRKIGARPFV